MDIKDFLDNSTDIRVNFLETIFQALPASCYAKDLKGKYLEVNKIETYTYGSKNASELLGKTDYELAWGYEQANIYLNNDREVCFIEHPKIFIEPCIRPDNKLKNFLTYKLPLKNRLGKKIGVTGISFLLDKPNNVYNWLTNSGFYIGKTSSKKSPFDTDNIKLTSRQIHCLHYLTKGMTIKQIANALALSPRTVEHHFEAIKIKLNCYSRHELIEKAFQIGINNQILNIPKIF